MLTSPLEVWNVAACAGNWTYCTPAAANCLTSCCCCCEETTGWVVDDETEGWAVLGVDHMGCCCLGVSPGIVLTIDKSGVTTFSTENDSSVLASTVVDWRVSGSSSACS